MADIKATRDFDENILNKFFFNLLSWKSNFRPNNNLLTHFWYTPIIYTAVRLPPHTRTNTRARTHTHAHTPSSKSVYAGRNRHFSMTSFSLCGGWGLGGAAATNIITPVCQTERQTFLNLYRLKSSVLERPHLVQEVPDSIPGQVVPTAYIYKIVRVISLAWRPAI